MKFFRIPFFLLLALITIISCKKEGENPWQKQEVAEAPSVQVTDLSKEFYDTTISLEQFSQKYPWFQGTVSDEDYALRRQDADEQKIYKEAISKLDVAKLQKELGKLFAQIQVYFPDFKTPHVYLYSSVLEGALDPVFYYKEEDKLFIDITGFMGENNPNYKGMEQYFQKSMNPQNMVPKVSQILGEHFLPPLQNQQKFLDQIIHEGKLLILQDAFMPGEPDYLKINYTPEQYEWAAFHEAAIWNYFVENNLVFSDDARLAERFIRPGPFSKFYTEIDNESSPQIGRYSGWQICRTYFKGKPETKLPDFLMMDARQIFNESNYKPKNP